MTGTKRWRHKKRGTTYREIGRAKMQASRPDGWDMTDMVIYQAESDGAMWVRPVAEFEDGRFELIEATLPPPAETAARANLREGWAAMAMIRETLETLAPIGSVKSAEHLDGPTFMHEAEALLEAIRQLAARVDEVRAKTISECAAAAKIATLGASILVTERVQNAINRLSLRLH